MDVQTKNKILRLIAAMCTLVFLSCTASAEVVSPGDDFWYLDEANVLSDATEGEIFFANQRLYEACGAEIVIAAIETTGRMAIDDYAYTLFNEWEIGGNSYRGMLLLMAIGDDNYYAMPGTNMGHLFDSATLNQMLQTYLEPDFAAKNYDRGARLFFEAIYEKTVDDLNLNLSIAEAKADYEAFIRNTSASEQNTQTNVFANPYAYEHSAPANHSSGTIGVLPVLILLIIAFTVIRRSFRSAPGYAYRPHRSRGSSLFTGFLLGRMTSPRRRYPGPGHIHRGPHISVKPPTRNLGSMHRPSGSSFSSGFTSRSTGGGFGGASRPSGGGFGGASRSGGASRGPSTRGGGSGRFSR